MNINKYILHIYFLHKIKVIFYDSNVTVPYNKLMLHNIVGQGIITNRHMTTRATKINYIINLKVKITYVNILAFHYQYYYNVYN